MSRQFVIYFSVTLVVGVCASQSYGQLDGLYEFDGGGDGTSWNDALNWEQVLDPTGNPISGDPATPPDGVTSADIPLAGVVVNAPGQTALDVNIGTAAGAGSLAMSGGDFTVRRIRAGRDANGVNAGNFDLSGGTLVAGDDIRVGEESAGIMTMSGGDASTGDDFFVRDGSSFTMTGGTVFVGDRFVTEDDATVLIDGGEVTADDDFFFFGDAQITVNSGSMIVFDKMRFDDDDARNGKLTINGGFVRSQEFGFVNDTGEHVLRGVVEINGNGFYQAEAPGDDTPVSQLSEALATQLIADGYFITSEASPLQLAASTVIVPEFDGRTDVAFTQISLVPEPAGALLAAMAAAIAGFRRRR